MTCPKCHTAVPDRSAFCLACGARLAPGPAPAPKDGNGGAPAAAPSPAAPSGRQAYALSFRPIVDERLRYRLARWVVERAPAHALAEVQGDLQQGTFLTFLALTGDEAEAARRGLEGLGVPAALLHLAPATAAQMLVPERRARPVAGEARSIGLRDWRIVLVAAVGMLVFGLVVARLFGGRAF